MENILEYIIKSSLILSVIFLLYQLFLKNDKNFTRNRIFLIAGSLLSLIVPFIDISAKESGATGAILLQPVMAGRKLLAITVHQNFNLVSIMVAIYFFIVIILLLSRLVQIFRIFRLALNSEKESCFGYKIIRTREEVSPFSFFKMIFIDRKLWLKNLSRGKS